MKNCHEHDSQKPFYHHDIDTYINGNVDFSLFSPIALAELAKAHMFDAELHGQWKWTNGLSYCRLFSDALKYSWKWFWGEDRNPVSNIHNMAHAACCMLKLVHFSFGRSYSKHDDRPLESARKLDTTMNEQLDYGIPDAFRGYINDRK